MAGWRSILDRRVTENVGSAGIEKKSTRWKRFYSAG
jgi:hypothetical protein